MNNGYPEITLTFLGTGTSQGVPILTCKCPVCQSPDPKDKRLRSSVLVNVLGKNILIDAGPDFRQQMLTNAIQSLHAILLTHEHVDHMFGLDDIRPFNWVQKKPMDIYAEARVETAIKRIFDYVFAKYRYPGIPQMNIHTIENKPFEIDGLDILPVRGYHHKLPVFGYRIFNLAYITDVNRIQENELEKLQGLDVLVLNALRKETHISHFNLDKALKIVEAIKPRKTYLTHISHSMGFHEEISKQLPDNVFLAYDNLTITI